MTVIVGISEASNGIKVPSTHVKPNSLADLAFLLSGRTVTLAVAPVDPKPGITIAS